jgi:hypothetical protein
MEPSRIRIGQAKDWSVGLSAGSAAIAVVLCVWAYHKPDSWIPILLLGPAHGIAFIPLTFLVGPSIVRNCVVSALCLGWAFWGYALMMGATGIVAPLASSFIWGILIAWAWRRLLAVPILLVVGGVTLASTFAMMDIRYAWKSEWLIPETIVVWYLLMVPALPLIVRSQALKSSSPNIASTCENCNYPLAGLPRVSSCSECGGPKSVCPECGLGHEHSLGASS